MPSAIRHSIVILMFITSILRKAQIHSCHAYNLSRDLAFGRCCYPFDPPLLRFYQSNFHEKRNRKQLPSLPKSDALCGDDAVYVLRRQNDIIAALRLTRSKNDDQYTFLRSLCVSREHRRQGLASRLLDESVKHFDARNLYCFASPNLTHFYRHLGFQTEEQMESIPKWLTQSYESMAARWSPKELGMYIKPSLSPTDVPQIVLLQHWKERAKNGATGWLLDDMEYFKHFENASRDDAVQNRMQLKCWTWGGRNSSSMIEDEIKRLMDMNRVVYLLWTGDGASVEPTNDTKNHAEPVAATYIILDGTWQQARRMYRKITSLWKLPRVSLEGSSDVLPSAYTLRGDYSGWRERFSSDDGRDLLCTAEVAAAVLDLRGDFTSANVIRMRLDTFQSTFPNKK